MNEKNGRAGEKEVVAVCNYIFAPHTAQFRTPQREAKHGKVQSQSGRSVARYLRLYPNACFHFASTSKAARPASNTTMSTGLQSAPLVLADFHNTFPWYLYER